MTALNARRAPPGLERGRGLSGVDCVAASVRGCARTLPTRFEGAQGRLGRTALIGREAPPGL